MFVCVCYLIHNCVLNFRTWKRTNLRKTRNTVISGRERKPWIHSLPASNLIEFRWRPTSYFVLVQNIFIFCFIDNTNLLLYFFRKWNVVLNFKPRSNRSQRKWVDISAAFQDRLCPTGTIKCVRDRVVKKERKKREREKERKREKVEVRKGHRNENAIIFVFCPQSWLCSHEGGLGIQRGWNREEQTHSRRIDSST